MTLGESRHDVLTQQLEVSRHLIVFNEPASPEVEDEYNAWYGGDHLPRILASVQTITSAKRYRIAPGRNSPIPGAPRYLTIYDTFPRVRGDLSRRPPRHFGWAVAGGLVA